MKKIPNWTIGISTTRVLKKYDYTNFLHPMLFLVKHYAFLF